MHNLRVHFKSTKNCALIILTIIISCNIGSDPERVVWGVFLNHGLLSLGLLSLTSGSACKVILPRFRRGDLLLTVGEGLSYTSSSDKKSCYYNWYWILYHGSSSYEHVLKCYITIKQKLYMYWGGMFTLMWYVFYTCLCSDIVQVLLHVCVTSTEDTAHW